MHGKPALCFMPGDDTSDHFRHDSQLIHFQDMFNMPEILKAWGSNELIPKVLELMRRAQKNNWKERLKKSSHNFVEPHSKPYGERLREFILDIVSQHKR